MCVVMVFLFEDDVQKGVWVRVCFWGYSIWCGVNVFLVGAEGDIVRELIVSWEGSWCKWMVEVRDAVV